MPNSDIIDELLSKYPLVSDQVDKTELSVILYELLMHKTSLNTGVSVVEFGCYIGTTSLFIRRTLDILGSPAVFHVYDSFAGLPEKAAQDQSPAGEQFRAGELAISRKQFEQQFRKANLKAPVVHKGWFSDLQPAAVPDTICFAYLDGDYYESIRDSLRLIWPKLAPGATIVVDDYANEALPGAARAVDEWLRTYPATLRVQSSLAILKLPTA